MYDNFFMTKKNPTLNTSLRKKKIKATFYVQLSENLKRSPTGLSFSLLYFIFFIRLKKTAFCSFMQMCPCFPNSSQCMTLSLFTEKRDRNL